MKLLVIGGSYFLGKHFVNIASKENEVTVFNRGSRPLNIEGLREIHGDRNNSEDLKKLGNMDFDTVIDFCAYNPGNIKDIIDALDGKISQYIFISTVDVYKKGTNRIIDENSPLETTVYAGEVGQYIAGKVALESELRECCESKDIAYTSVRPAIIYGPDNYAPREGIYFNWIEKAGQVLAPEGATGFFQMVYVDDLADIILGLCNNEKFYNKAVNVCSDEICTYDTFIEALAEGTGKEFQTISIPVNDVLEKGIPLPFPLTEDESERYVTGYSEIKEKINTSLAEGIKLSYHSYLG